MSNEHINKYSKGSWVNLKIINDRIDSSFYKYEDIEVLKMLYKNCPVKSIVDISQDIKDGPHDGYTFVKDGILFMRSQNIKNCGFDFSDTKYIERNFHEKHKKSWLEAGDILLTRIGEYYGNAAVVSSEYRGCNINHAIAKIKVKNEYDPYFVCAYINSRVGNKLYRRLGRSFTSPRVNLGDLIDFPVPIPPPEVQEYIGNKVRKAERLREEANKLKKEADDILNNLLDLTSLEKIISKETTNKYKWIKSDNIVNRLDSEYYKKIYLITVNHLKNICKKYLSLKKITSNIYTGKKPKPVNEGVEVFFVQSGDFSSDNLELKRKVLVCLRDYKPLEYNDLLFAKDGETIGKIAINLSNDAVIINEHTYCLRLKQNYKHYSAYIYYLLTNPIVNILIRREATGSAQKGLGQELFNNIFIPLIDEEVINNLYNIERKRYTNIAQINDLIQEAKKDVEDLIEGKFDYSKVQATVPESR